MFRRGLILTIYRSYLITSLLVFEKVPEGVHLSAGTQVVKDTVVITRLVNGIASGRQS